MNLKLEKSVLIDLIKKAINGDEASRRILARRNIRLTAVDVDFLLGDDSNPMAEIHFNLHPDQIIDRKQAEAARIKMYEEIIQKNKDAIEWINRPISPVFLGIILPIIFCLAVSLYMVCKNIN